jgi:hypothetical protein
MMILKGLPFTILLLMTSAIPAQEFAGFSYTAINQGIGEFENAILPDFEWAVEGTLSNPVQILDSEVFDDGSEFENIFGQADNAQNLRIKVIENGPGTNGQPITSSAILTINFDQHTPDNGWGFCLVDIDVENVLISAIDQEDNVVASEVIDNWLIELFDANITENGINLPKWDPVNSALLGSDTPPSYTVYNNLVIGGMPSCEAPAAFFMPDQSLKTLIINFENLQELYSTSYHFYIASLNLTADFEQEIHSVDIYPNPTAGTFQICGLDMDGENIIIALYDQHGSKVFQNNMPAISEPITLNVSDLPSGMYYCKVLNNVHVAIQKLIIQKVCP